MKAVKQQIHTSDISSMKLSDMSRIVDSVTVSELKETEKDVQRVFKGWRK